MSYHIITCHITYCMTYDVTYHVWYDMWCMIWHVIWHAIVEMRSQSQLPLNASNSTLQHAPSCTATHCNTPHYALNCTATRCNTLSIALQHAATRSQLHCNTPQQAWIAEAKRTLWDETHTQEREGEERDTQQYMRDTHRPSRCNTRCVATAYPQKSPVYPQKSPIYPQRSRVYTTHPYHPDATEGVLPDTSSRDEVATIYPQKSPTYPPKSPAYPQKSPVYLTHTPEATEGVSPNTSLDDQVASIYPQKSPVHLHRSPVYPPKSPVHPAKESHISAKEPCISNTHIPHTHQKQQKERRQTCRRAMTSPQSPSLCLLLWSLHPWLPPVCVCIHTNI